MLKTETNTEAIRKRIHAAAWEKGFSQFWLVYEHGQWWLVKVGGALWSVVDAEGGPAIDGFDFEQVTEDDED